MLVRPPRIMLVLSVATFCCSASAASVVLLEASFDAPLDGPALSVSDAELKDGTLRSASLANWKRCGLEVGPISVPEDGLTIAYDFRPLKLGRQCQEFTSQSPRTHWYMMYVSPDGTLRLHTRHQGRWQARGQSVRKAKVGTWYCCRVALECKSIRLIVTERESKEPIWDTGATPMDDIGESTVFMLTDEAPAENEGSTEWDNFTVSTDDAAFAKRFVGEMKRLAEEKRRRERERAEAAKAAEELRSRGIALIPMPQKVRLDRGEYAIGDAALSFPSALAPEAQLVRTIIHEQTGRDHALQENGTTGIVLTRVTKGPWPTAKTRPCEGYRLAVTAGGVRIEAQTRSGFLCAAQTLSQLVRGRPAIPALEIIDWPAIENRLVMIAVSQGGWQVIDIDYWKRIIRELSNVKVNMIMPYFEGGTYYYEKYPFLGVKGRDGFTGDKARLLSEYAHQHGVELLPQQEALGHSGNVLHHKQLADLRESGGVFCSSKPEVFEFLGDLFDELVAAFPRTRYLHVGGDEFTHGFAKCPQCKARAEEVGKHGLYAEHMMHLRQMLAKRNRKMMIWWHERGFTEKAADLLAKDIVVFDWHYGNQRSYPSIERLQKLGFPVWATPAVTRYYAGTNDFHNTLGNIRGFLTAGVERGVPGQCTCTWVHGIWGGRNLFELNYYALLYNGQCAWKPANADEEDFRWRVARHWFGLEGDGLAEQVLQAWHAPFGDTKDQGFWRSCRDAEPRLAASPAATIADLEKSPGLAKESERLMSFCQRARAVLERWKSSATRNQVTVDFLLHDVHIYETLVRRIRTLDGLRRRYPEARAASADQRAALLAPVLTGLEKLIADYREMEHMFDRSIKEAGGARCGRGSFSGGEIRFNSPEGRAGLEKLLSQLQSLEAKAEWPKALPR